MNKGQLEVQGFIIQKVDWKNYHQALRKIRDEVFIQEQQVPIEEEWDGLDETAIHYLCTHHDQPVGTARLIATGKIGRMAVVKNMRGSGIGFAILETLIKENENQFDKFYLHAQVSALGFYEKAGFTGIGRHFMEAGIEHQKMEKINKRT